MSFLNHLIKVSGKGGGLDFLKKKFSSSLLAEKLTHKNVLNYKIDRNTNFAKLSNAICFFYHSKN